MKKKEEEDTIVVGLIELIIHLFMTKRANLTK